MGAIVTVGSNVQLLVPTESMEVFVFVFRNQNESDNVFVCLLRIMIYLVLCIVICRDLPAMVTAGHSQRVLTKISSTAYIILI